MDYHKLPQNINNIICDNVKLLAQLFPTAVKDGQVDFEALKEELGQFEEVGKEKYELTWAGKQNAKKLAQEDVYNRTLKYIAADSKNPETTENLYIEGDNLEVLKLLRQNYYGAIKMIYIDPPYNTGNDFVYNDNFATDRMESDIAEGTRDDDGKQLQKNQQSSNRYHANWLNMMYPRLKVAKDLLTDDGVIFISIDDNEVAQLRKICDEVFGEDNLLINFYNQVRYEDKNLAETKPFKPVIEQILVYSKNSSIFTPKRPIEEYTDDNFIYEIKELAVGAHYKINSQEVVVFKQGEWEITKHLKGNEKYLKETWISGSIYSKMSYGQVVKQYIEPRLKDDGLCCLYKVIGRGDDGLGYRYYSGPQKSSSTRYKMFSGMPLERVEEKRNGVSVRYLPIVNFKDYAPDFGNIVNEGGVKYNSGKKPIKMLKSLIDISDLSDGDTVLDFFSGSASTAHTVMQFNSEEGSNLKFIMVQLPESLSDTVKEQKDAYVFLKSINKPTILSEIGKERIRRAGEKIKEEIETANAQLKLGEEPKQVPDIGFKVFRTADTNIKWNLYNELGQIDTATMAHTPDLADFTIGFNDIDVVYEVMLRQKDVPLSTTLETLSDIGSRTYLYGSAYLVCLETEITETLIDKLASLDPLPIKFIFRDSAFKDDINLKDETFRRLKNLIERNSGLTKKAYTVEFI